MYGQMTAASWIYLGTQGILQGTFETLAEVPASTSTARCAASWCSPLDWAAGVNDLCEP